MSVNVNSPFGFAPNGSLGGSTPNFRLSRRKIDYQSTTPIYSGDPVQNQTSTYAGYIQQAVAYSGTIYPCGIFWGCKYLSTSQGRTVWSRFWPGSDAAADVTAYVIDNPDATFVCQTDSSGMTLANINQNCNWTIGTGSTLTGTSNAVVTGASTTAGLPLIVLDLVTDPTGAPGTDTASGYNWVIVGWNTEVFKAGQTAI